MNHKKELQEVVTCIVDAMPPSDPMLACEALGRVAAVLLVEFSDADFEIWVTAVRETRHYVKLHGQLQ